MFIDFFLTLRAHRLPVTLKEHLLFIELLSSQQSQIKSLEDFYYLARLSLVKDEKFFDRFDVAYSHFLENKPSLEALETQGIPKAWLEKQLEKYLTEEEKALVNSLGGFEQLLETFKKRMQEQKDRHQGGNKWIGTGGTSPFGAYGYNPEGFRLGQSHSRHRRAVKVWDKRQFANLEETSALSERNLLVALKHLTSKMPADRTEFDLDGTIQATAKQAGWLDLQYQQGKPPAPHILMLFDIGGSMDPYIELAQSLFDAARKSFKSVTFFYFHNCLYETVWRDNYRRQDSAISTLDLLKAYGKTHQLIIVGDALMSPYEIIYPGGSVEHMNQESGQVWLTRLTKHFKSLVWLNPLEKAMWQAPSVTMIQQQLDNRMFPLTIEGIDHAMRSMG